MGKRTAMRRLLGFTLLLLLSCSPGAQQETAHGPLLPVTEQSLVWPRPPGEPQIALLGGFTGSDDLGRARSLFDRFGELLGVTTSERLLRPTGIAARGDLLAIADPGRRALFRVDLADGSFEKITSADDRSLVSPVAVAIGDEDEIYLADSALGRIYVYGKDGRLRSHWGEGDLTRPTGVALDGKRKRLYVVDAFEHRVVAYGLDGNILFTFGGRGIAPGKFNWPSTVCLDGEGLVYVVDALNFRVQVFDGDGRFLSGFGRPGDGSGDFARPKGVSVDSLGNIYVVDALFDTVQLFDVEGRFLMDFGRRGTKMGELWLPTGIAIDGRDRIYVSDSYNKRIQVFQFLAGL